MFHTVANGYFALLFIYQRMSSDIYTYQQLISNFHFGGNGVMSLIDLFLKSDTPELFMPPTRTSQSINGRSQPASKGRLPRKQAARLQY